MKRKYKSTRRKFIKDAGIAVSAIIAAPTIIPASCVGKGGQTPPSDRINLAFIGAGNQGQCQDDKAADQAAYPEIDEFLDTHGDEL